MEKYPAPLELVRDSNFPVYPDTSVGVFANVPTALQNGSQSSIETVNIMLLLGAVFHPNESMPIW